MHTDIESTVTERPASGGFIEASRKLTMHALPETLSKEKQQVLDESQESSYLFNVADWSSNEKRIQRARSAAKGRC
jgi:hypothetical protein